MYKMPEQEWAKCVEGRKRRNLVHKPLLNSTYEQEKFNFLTVRLEGGENDKISYFLSSKTPVVPSYQHGYDCIECYFIKYTSIKAKVCITTN